MLVCHCLGVSDRVIRSAVRNGATCRSSVGDACGAGTGCGGCLPMVETLIDEETTSRASSRSLPVFGASLVLAAG